MAAILAARIGRGSLAGINPDVVIDTQNGIPFFARWVSPAPVVVLVHHCHKRQWPVAGALMGKVGWFIESWLSPRVHRDAQYLTVSLPSAEDLVSLGVDARAGGRGARRDRSVAGRRTRRADRPRLHAGSVCCRGLVPHKQIEHALEVMARISATHPDVMLDVIGDGWWSEELRAKAI